MEVGGCAGTAGEARRKKLTGSKEKKSRFNGKRHTKNTLIIIWGRFPLALPERKKKTGSRKKKAGSRKKKAGSRKKKAGPRKKETG